MYGEFTDRGCRVLLEMRTEAFLLDHDHTGTEHLILGVLEANDDITGPALSRLGITADGLRSEIKELARPINPPGPKRIVVGSGTSPSSDSVTSPRAFTSRLTTCLRLAGLERDGLGDERMGPEHLLLGVLRKGDGVGVQALRGLGVEPSDLRTAIYERISEVPGASDTSGPKPTDRDPDATLDARRLAAQGRMHPEDRIVFTFTEASHVFCVLDGLDRYLTPPRTDGSDLVVDAIHNSFLRRSGQPDRTQFTLEQVRQIVRSIVSQLARSATDQLED